MLPSRVLTVPPACQLPLYAVRSVYLRSAVGFWLRVTHAPRFPTVLPFSRHLYVGCWLGYRAHGTLPVGYGYTTVHRTYAVPGYACVAAHAISIVFVVTFIHCYCDLHLLHLFIYFVTLHLTICCVVYLFIYSLPLRFAATVCLYTVTVRVGLPVTVVLHAFTRRHCYRWFTGCVRVYVYLDCVTFHAVTVYSSSLVTALRFAVRLPVVLGCGSRLLCRLRLRSHTVTVPVVTHCYGYVAVGWFTFAHYTFTFTFDSTHLVGVYTRYCG